MAHELPKYLTRGEVALLIGMSTEFVAMREQELGLTAARVIPAGQTARYHREAALTALRAIGALDPGKEPP